MAATAEVARGLLSLHGAVRSQPASDWTGNFNLPSAVARYYSEVGPVDVVIKAYGNPFTLPQLRRLADYQAGYRHHGRTGERLYDWKGDWLAVGDDGGGVFIFTELSGSVSYAGHGGGIWTPVELFPDLNTMVACLAHLGSIAKLAGENLTDDESRLRAEHIESAQAGLCDLLGSLTAAQRVLQQLSWE